MESHVVTGIAFSKDEAQISVRQIEDKPGVAAAIFGPLADANINVDMIVQNVSEDGATTDLTFTVPASDYARARDTITSAKAKIGYARLDSATDVANVVSSADMSVSGTNIPPYGPKWPRRSGNVSSSVMRDEARRRRGRKQSSA